MPTIHSIVPEADSHVYMPVLQQVAHHIVNSLNINQYIENNIYIETGWTSPKSTRKGHTFFTRTNTLRIVADQLSFNNSAFEYLNFNHVGGIFNPSTMSAHFKIAFHDPSADVTLYEIPLPASFNLNCTLWFQSRNVAYETLKKLQLKFMSGYAYSLAMVYDYAVPKDIVNTLIALHKYRVFGSGDDRYSKILEERGKVSFADWLNVNSLSNFVTTTSRARPDEKELCVNKVIDNTLIQFDFDLSKPEESKINNIAETYNINFTAKIQFGEVSAMVIRYPCIIDSVPLEANLIPELRRNDTPIFSTMPRHDIPHMNEEYHRRAAVKVSDTGLVKYPHYDDWLMPMGKDFQRSYRPFFCSLFYKDEGSDVLTLDLKEPLWGDQSLHPIVIEVLQAQLKESFNMDALFHIGAYVRDIKQARMDFDLSEDLILTVKCRDVPPQRHLYISEITALRFLNPKWYEFLKKYPGFFVPGAGQGTGLGEYLEELLDKQKGGYDATIRAPRIFNTGLIPKRPVTRDQQTYGS